MSCSCADDFMYVYTYIYNFWNLNYFSVALE